MQIQPIVIGTAGHIDHGKSSLVKALTGTDPDRWAEEKERGMTIDLGFAWMELEDGRRVGLVDVPGHERFIRNMVAGASGIDLVILVVAADDGVMPQTREHLSIMQLLGVKRGMIALTKVDIVDEDMVELAAEDVADTVAGTFLEGAPMIHVSSLSGLGIPEVRATLAELAKQVDPRAPDGIFRMPVQRVFSARGFGTIVTGIPVSGMVKVGDVVEVLPAGQKGKIRGIQAYHEATDTARAGHSSALNISDVDHHAVERGHVVSTPGFFTPQTMVGARLLCLPTADRSVTNRMRVRVHTGTSEALGELVLLDAEELGPGDEGLVQFRLEHPMVCAPGDHFVARLESPVVTLGGGVILEESRYRLKRFKTFVIDELQRQAASLGSPSALLESHLVRAKERWLSVEELAKTMKMPRAETVELLDSLAAEGKVRSLGAAKRFLHTEVLTLCLEETREAIKVWFDENPLRGRMDIRDLRSRLTIDNALLAGILDEEAEAGRVVLGAGGFLSPAGREVELDEETRTLFDGVVSRMDAARFQPPSPEELSADCGVDRERIDMVLRLGADQGAFAHVGGEMHMSAAVLSEARDAVIANCTRNGHLEIPELRDTLDTTRKFLIPILEHLDTEGITLRQAGRRVLKRS